MKKALVFLLLIVSFSALAQSTDEEKIELAIENLRIGIVKGDKALLESATAKGLVYAHSSGKVDTREQFIGEIASGKPIDVISAEISGQSIRLAGKNAVVHHIFTLKMVNAGVESNVKIGAMLVWQKQRGNWKLIARQGYKL